MQLSQKDYLEAGSSKVSSVLKDNLIHRGQKFFTESLLTEHAISSCRNVSDDTNRGIKQSKPQSERKFSGPLTYHKKREGKSEPFANINEETSVGKVFQQKGRFKITSEDPGTKGICSTNVPTNPTIGAPTTVAVATGTALLPLPPLQFILQQNSMQREHLYKLIRCMEQASSCHTESVDLGPSELSEHLNI